MSKYLRTKDNLYEIESSFVDYRGTRIYQTVKNVLVEETEVVALGDAFDEVCDFFVIRVKDNENELIDGSFDGNHFGYVTCNTFKHALELVNRCEPEYKDKVDCFGVICTSYGFIYKAKLNKESEVLELL